MGKSKRGNKKVMAGSEIPEEDSHMPELMDINDTADEQAQLKEILLQAQSINDELKEVTIDNKDEPMFEIKPIRKVNNFGFLILLYNIKILAKT